MKKKFFFNTKFCQKTSKNKEKNKYFIKKGN